MLIISFHPHSHHLRWIPLSSFYRCGNWGSQDLWSHRESQWESWIQTRDSTTNSVSSNSTIAFYSWRSWHLLISKLVLSLYRPLILKWKHISELFPGMIHFAVYIPETVIQHENIDLLGKRVKDQVKNLLAFAILW